MAILWCGGEDIDFPNGTGTMLVNGTAPTNRSGISRAQVLNNTIAGNPSKFLQSQPFPGGAVTSAWFTYQHAPFQVSAGRMHIGVSLSGTSKGLFVGIDSTTASKLALYKFDGTTKTQLVQESGVSLTASSNAFRIDMQIINYGASATVFVYLNSTLLLTFAGDVTVSGMSNFDSISIAGEQSGYFSECIVSTTDTRPISALQTLALTGAGTTNNWTNNTFSNINGTTISDTNPTSSNLNNQVQDYNITDAIAGTYNVDAIKISARMAKSATPAVNQVQLGYNNGAGSSASGTGATKAVATVYTTYEQLDVTNPITATAWAKADINALQLELTAKT